MAFIVDHWLFLIFNLLTLWVIALYLKNKTKPQKTQKPVSVTSALSVLYVYGGLILSV